MNNIDYHLNLRARHPDFQTFINYNHSESQRVKEQYHCHLNVAYGANPLQTIDIFPSKIPNSPVLIFIHGGYWRALDKSSYSFVAEPFVQHNFSVFVINYRLIPEVDLAELVQDITLAVNWVKTQAKTYQGNASAITLSGHSAGGHLALMAYLLNPALRPHIAAICSISGLFDLKPIQQSYLNEVLQLDDATVATYSPIYQDLSVVQCPFLLSVGLGETELFVKQSLNLYKKNQENQSISYLGINDLNHYQIIHELGKEESALTQFILKKGKI
ncbi:MAG TPA: alpha/beta hydrolase [Microscillaceae bacterium]|nr:alpha/beta hydrolase [Microscillaceae bacterium]